MVASIGLFAIAAVLMIGGILLLLQAQRDRLLGRSLDFWLGAFMVADGSLYLRFAMLSAIENDAVPLDWQVHIFLIAVPAVIYLFRWART